MAEKLFMISKICFSLAAVCLIVTIIISLYFKIWSVFQYLSQRGVRWSDKNTRKYKKENRKRVVEKEKQEDGQMPKTEILKGNMIGDIKESRVTQICNEKLTEKVSDERRGGIPIEILDEVMLIHTDEIIW